MGKRSVGTPRSKVRQALRMLSLRSRERQAALKRDGYMCQVCHVKQSKRKGAEVVVEVHHLKPPDWEQMINYVFEHLLIPSAGWITLCKACHEKETKGKECLRTN